MPITHGANVQLAETDTTPAATEEEKKLLQQAIGAFLCCGRAINSSILVALSNLASDQTIATSATMKEMNHLLDCLAAHPVTIIRCRQSAVQPAMSSNASCLSASRGRSRAGGYFCLSETASHDPHKPPPPISGGVLVNANILKPVMASAAEAEIGATFVNGQAACPIINALDEMGWPQGTAQITTDNESGEDFKKIGESG